MKVWIISFIFSMIYLKKSNDFKCFCNPMLIFSSIGLACLVNVAFQLILLFNEQCLRKEKNLLQRYGQNSWAVITGGANGIGLGFSKALAQRGFNIFFMDVDQTAALKAIEIIKEQNNNIQIQHLIVDFSKSFEENFFDEIYKKIKHLDISILVNNVGIVSFNEFAETDENNIKNMIRINIMPQLMITRKILPQMKQRSEQSNKTKKCAIITMSSEAANSAAPFLQLYSCTKVFNDYLSRSVAFEFNENIDFLSCKPLYVYSNMTKVLVGPKDFFVISTDTAVKNFLRDLGYANQTVGHFKHIVQKNIFKFLRNFMGEGFNTKLVKMQLAKIKETKLEETGTKKIN